MSVHNQIFDPEKADLLGLAFNKAWQTAQADPVLNESSAFTADQMREALAIRIIELAKTGESDPERLKDGALKHLVASIARADGKVVNIR